MGQLCIIPCGTKKIWDRRGDIGPVRAQEAYIGTFHNLCERYAEMFFNQWVILSAKYGYLLPDDIVDANYDVTFNQKSNEIISTEELRKQVQNKFLYNNEGIVVLTGKKYIDVVTSSFQQEDIQFPLTSCKGIGYMQQKLKFAIEHSQPIHCVKSE
ncbi:hypothetical protein GH741_03945 [Aquibacillus halophilus]|uniref:DUF6884 domain-containing protein n=1 Tax=Aquibacillus halophilus TaxID=930132 RepID=A0A6A8D7U4_9BACI|nr:DUF6884 domain-containing protein [Aquibacillus halophilus]MRH41823.1 hypothetical protein [Aquibacillus halophilus]